MVGGVDELAVFVDDVLEVFPYGSLQLGVAQQCRGMESGYDQPALPLNPLAAELGDMRRGVDEALECGGTQEHDDGWVDDFYLLEEQG